MTSSSQTPVVSLQKSLTLVTVSGCLAMVFATATGCPAFVQFLRQIGASESDFGLIGGIPMIMLAMQFVGAAITNNIRRRKPLFMVLVIAGRFLYIPMALVPAFFPGVRDDFGVLFVLICLAVSGGLMNMAGPLWLSWMADLIPRRVLNTYWGRRQRWMYIAWTVSFLSIAAFVSLGTFEVKRGYVVLATVGAVAGIVDIILFIWVHEPANTVNHGQHVLASLIAPLRSRDYRAFVVFSCVWSAVAMFGATFMQVYALEVLELSLWQATIAWCAAGFGIALVSTRWGRMADKVGHRPILVICIAMKSIIVLAFMLVTPETALWVLSGTLFLDSFWNAGIMVSSNGYMLKIAPRKNRSMFIAAITGLAGVCGGLGAIFGGVFLDVFANADRMIMGRLWNPYQFLFGVSVVLRVCCIGLAFRVHEPKAMAPEALLYQMRGMWPMRFMLFPVGMYRTLSNWSKKNHATDTKDG